MRLRKTRNFIKQYKKLPDRVKQQFKARLALWLTNPEHPTLRVHPLKGDRQGCWSMNVSGDVRAIYYYEGEEAVVFVLIGSHSQLY